MLVDIYAKLAKVRNDLRCVLSAFRATLVTVNIYLNV